MTVSPMVGYRAASDATFTMDDPAVMYGIAAWARWMAENSQWPTIFSISSLAVTLEQGRHMVASCAVGEHREWDTEKRRSFGKQVPGTLSRRDIGGYKVKFGCRCQASHLFEGSLAAFLIPPVEDDGADTAPCKRECRLHADTGRSAAYQRIATKSGHELVLSVRCQSGKVTGSPCVVQSNVKTSPIDGSSSPAE